MKLYKKVIDVISKIAGVLAEIMIAGLVVIIIAEIINRDVFNHSFAPTIELCGILFMWMAYVALIPIFRREGLLSLTFLKDRVHGWVAHVFYLISQLAVILLGAVMVVSFINMYPYTNTRFYATIQWLPYSVLFFPTALVGVCMVLISVYQIIDYIQTKIIGKGEAAEK